jgi:PAS domain S-box-containing protein
MANVVAEAVDRGHMEEALRSSEEHYRQIVEGSQEGIWTADANNRVTFANKRIGEILHYPTEELVGRSLFDFVDSASTPEVESRDARRQSGDNPADNHLVVFRRRDGVQVWTRVTASVIRDPSGNYVGALALVTDDTERHEAEQNLAESQEKQLLAERQLEQAQRVTGLGRVAATIAHEFNNVLMGIQPFAEIIHRRAGDDERVLKAAEQISNSVRRGKRVTEEILRFSRPSEPKLEVIDMAKWVATIEPELRGVVASNVRLTVLTPKEPLFARCDAAQLQQVVANLVVNARDAMPSGGTVTLTLDALSLEDNVPNALSGQQRFVQLTVRDTGSGIPAEMFERIFDPFVTTKRSGTGLGLAVARQVVVQHGGKIFAENAAGGGTAFHILLPQVDEVLTKAAEVAPQGVSGRIRRVLLVEDEVSVAEGMMSLLESEEIVVRVIGLGREVVGAIEEFAPDAVILDLTLPDIDGREVFAQISARWPDLPVVFSTGHGGNADLANELSRGHVGFLQKPYDIDALLATIEAVL